MAITYHTELDNKIALTRFSRRVTAYINNNARDPALLALCTAFREAYDADTQDYKALTALMFLIKDKLNNG